MELLLALLPVIIIGGGFLYLLVSTLLRAVKLSDTNQIIWVIIIIFLFPLGSILFLILNPDKQ